jgi:hypothetical protein
MEAVTSRILFGCEPTDCVQERVVPVAADAVICVVASMDGDPATALLTVTVTVDESVVLPTLSVARAMIVYVPFVGWLFQFTVYGEPDEPIAVPVAQVHVKPAQYR